MMKGLLDTCWGDLLRGGLLGGTFLEGQLLGGQLLEGGATVGGTTVGGGSEAAGLRPDHPGLIPVCFELNRHRKHQSQHIVLTVDTRTIFLDNQDSPAQSALIETKTDRRG